MYGLENVNYSSISECADSIKQIAAGISEDRKKLKDIIDGLVVEDFDTDLTTRQLQDAVNGILYGVDRCVENLNKYSVHLTQVASEWQATDESIGNTVWPTLDKAEPEIKIPDIKDYI